MARRITDHSMNSIWEKPAAHDEILKKIWINLESGANNRKHPFHMPVFGTVGLENIPSLRTVVFRRFWREERRLVFHTHAGSMKIHEIENNNRVSWLFYNADEKIQTRIKGRALIHRNDAVADERWNATSLFSRRCYTGAPPSVTSQKATNGLPDYLNEREPTEQESAAGRANFAVISTSIDSIDCLELDFKGNRRSFFTFLENGEINAVWKTP